MGDSRNQFDYRCDLHNFTQKNKLQDTQDSVFKYKTIHTPRKTRFACMKQDIYDKWIIVVPLSTYFIPYICHNVNVTQSVGYIAFDTQQEAQGFLKTIKQNWIKLLVHITRYGNFNNIMVLRHVNFNYHQPFSEEEQNTIDDLIKWIKY